MMKHILHFPLTRVVVGLIVCVVIPITVQTILVKPLLVRFAVETPVRKNIQWVIAGGLMLTLYIALYTHYENRDITEFSPRHALKDAGLSLLAASVCVSLIVSVLALCGWYTVEGIRPAIQLLGPIVGISFLAFSEELVIRGMVYRILEDSLGSHVALLLASALFGAAHLSNAHASVFTGCAVALEGGLFVCLLYRFTGRLWGPIFFHIGWNYAQFFYGTNISGIDKFAYFLQGRVAGPTLWTGGAFGIENSVLTVGVYLSLSLFFYIRIRQTGRLKTPFWKRPNFRTGDDGGSAA